MLMNSTAASQPGGQASAQALAIGLLTCQGLAPHANLHCI